MRDLLKGANISLTAIREEDIATIKDWFDNVKFLRYYDMVPAAPKSYEQVEAIIKGYVDSYERYVFAIREKEKSKIIGIAGYDEIIWSNGVATAFIGIGNESYAGKGLGKEAMGLLLDFGFSELNFYKVQLNVISYNKIAIGLYESLGFVREGTYRQFINRDGTRYDMYLYGLLSTEWESILQKYKNKWYN